MKSICVFGVFVADLCFIGEKIPEVGQTILGTKHLIGPGGKGSNQAIAAARLGGNISFITKIGDDNNAEMALNLYKSSGVNTDYIIKDKNYSTGVAGIMKAGATGQGRSGGRYASILCAGILYLAHAFSTAAASRV